MVSSIVELPGKQLARTVWRFVRDPAVLNPMESGVTLMRNILSQIIALSGGVRIVILVIISLFITSTNVMDYTQR